jgi:hypothetical protein
MEFEWSASRPGLITFMEIAAGTHWIRGWVGPRADLDTKRKTEILTQTLGNDKNEKT